jgi:hypothetical protein
MRMTFETHGIASETASSVNRFWLFNSYCGKILMWRFAIDIPEQSDKMEF